MFLLARSLDKFKFFRPVSPDPLRVRARARLYVLKSKLEISRSDKRKENLPALGPPPPDRCSSILKVPQISDTAKMFLFLIPFLLELFFFFLTVDAFPLGQIFRNPRDLRGRSDFVFGTPSE